MPQSSSAEDLEQLVSNVPFWWHSIDLGGIVTPGRKSAKLLAKELANYKLPDLHGKTVLDIGAWDGFFSFQAERLGAQRVVALDHFVWSIDFTKSKEQLLAAGYTLEQIRQIESIPEAWRPDELPGKRGFDLSHRALGSRVESVVADFMSTDLKSLGQFDVVFYLGILYHMRHPLLALERLAQVTKEFAVIETEAAYYCSLENRAWCEFFETDELNADPSNWWSPNAKALVGMCRAAGFRKVEVLVGPRPEFFIMNWLPRFLWKARRNGPFIRYRLVVRAYK